jgi:electron transfer flavoprotein beta subunit
VRILVAVKQVAVLDEEFALDRADTVPPDALRWRLNELDAHSIEAALILNEGEVGEVVAATVGDQQTEDALRSCLAMGADRAVRVWGEELAGADPLAVAAALAALARVEQPDLILCGAQSSDAADAATGVALAGLLDLPRVAVVTAIERDGDRLVVQRELDGGALEVLRVGTPAVLTVQTGINVPRHATLRAIKQARAKPVSALAPRELALDRPDIDAAAGSRRLRLVAPDTATSATLLEGGPDRIAAQIAEIVREAVQA